MWAYVKWGYFMDIIPELKNRESPLVFDKKDVEKEKIESLVEAARWAPSCFNNQSWNYVFVNKGDSTRKDLEEALSLGNKWAKKAPVLVAVGAKPDEDCDVNRLPYYAYDAGLSVMSMVVEAEHLGLRTHQMAGYDEEKVRKTLRFPESHRIIVLFALGYEGDVKSVWDKLEKRIKDRLAQPRTRKSTEKNFFFASFGNQHG
jgi:nitroreductase